MRKNVPYHFCGAFLLAFLAVTFCFMSAAIAEKDAAVILQVKPQGHAFRCAPVERAKEFMVTNVSKRTVAVNAVASHDWLNVTPATQPDVRPMGSAIFTVSVDCRKLDTTMPAKGAVLFEAMNGRRKVVITVNPAVEPIKVQEPLQLR
ncbi:MAG TPA: hypothetical protein PLI53_02230 [Geobacteraceae bacterium]|nr:hypothetical protein [Geobacteraceae bacterium]